MSPQAAWRTIAGERPGGSALLVRLVLPLALIPGIAWMLSLALFGTPAHGGGDAHVDPFKIASAGLFTIAGSVLWVLLSASVMCALVRLYGGDSSWRRSLQVAAYSAVPVLVGSITLVLPILTTVLVIAFFHGLYLQYAGVQHVLQIKNVDAAEFVALNTIALMVLLSLIGAVASAAGLMTFAAPGATGR